MERLVEKQKQWVKDIRRKVLDLTYATGSHGAHLGAGLSSAEIFAVLYSGILDISPSNATSPTRDRIIQSRGHGALAQYAALWKAGFMTEQELDTFDKNGTHFYSHAKRDLSHGIEFSGGSLSLGLSFAVGVALSCKRKAMDNRVIAVVGDGECDEGLVWEALMAASHFKLDNLTVIVDRNGYQLDGATADIMHNGALEKKFEAFGFAVNTVDGHDCAALSRALTARYDVPNVILADTVKAHGISFLENDKKSHMPALTKKQYEQALSEID